MKTIEIEDHLAKRLEALRFGDKSINDVVRDLLNYHLFNGRRENINIVFDKNLAERFDRVKPRNLMPDRFLYALLDFYLSGGKSPIISSGKPWNVQYISNYLKSQLDKEYGGSEYDFEQLLWFFKRVEKRCNCPAREVWNNGQPQWHPAPFLTRHQRNRAQEWKKEIYLKDVEPTHLLFHEYKSDQLILDGFGGCKTNREKDATKLAHTIPRTFRQYLVFAFYLPSWQRLFGEAIPVFDVLHDGDKLSIEAELRMKKW